MVNEFENSIDDSSKGGFGQCESTGPQTLQEEMLEVMAVTVMTRKVPWKILRERLKGQKPREGYSL